ncbi:hypothetical protein MKMG_00441 [Methanogenium sp. MK-MG]|nr:hypothetical protein MKMG_00441 [Methanogenium sp. MK-MG]
MTGSGRYTKRIGIAFAVLVLFAGSMLALQIAGEEWMSIVFEFEDTSGNCC